MDCLTNNHPELLGVETTLKRLLYELNIAGRDGTLKQYANLLADIQAFARNAEWAANDLIFPPPPPKIPDEEVE